MTVWKGRDHTSEITANIQSFMDPAVRMVDLCRVLYGSKRIAVIVDICLSG